MRKVYVKEEVCMGCRLCEVYCQLQQAQSDDLIKAFKRESPRPLPRLRVDEQGVVSFSVRCQQCDDAPCVRACLTGALTSLGPLIIFDLPVLPVTTEAWAGIAAVALFSIAAQLTINQALVRIPATVVSVIMTAEVPLVAGFGVVFLAEPFGWRLVTGASLIFGCGIGLGLLPSKSNS